MRTKKVVAAVTLLVVLALPLDAARRRSVRVPEPADSEFLAVAKEAAAWLMSVERTFAPDRIAWPRSMAAQQSFFIGVDAGASGTGFFFLRLYQVTRETKYLDRAKGAANYVAAAYAQGVNGFDWLGGAAGGGSFLLAVHRETGEQRYLDAARNAGDWLLRNALVDGNGIYWHTPGFDRTYTGLAHGAAGVSSFLIDLGETTKDPKYLDAAEKAFIWMQGYTIPAGDGFVWKRLTRDTVAYPGWCGGSSGIILFLDKLARATNDPVHRDALARTALGLANTALERPPDGAAWDHYGPNTGNGYVYCHGATSVIGALAVAYERTGDARLLETMRKAERFVAHGASHESGGQAWPQFTRSSRRETGLMTGTASIGHAYLRLWRVDPNPAHLERARAAAAWLSAIADHPAAGQTRWINYTHEPGNGDDPKSYETGWYSGAAGIGLFFLELHQTTRGVPVPADFSGVHP